MASGRAADRKDPKKSKRTERVVLIGTRSANSIRASGVRGTARNGRTYDCTDHFAKAELYILLRRGRPHMMCARNVKVAPVQAELAIYSANFTGPKERDDGAT
jgi:hypothetical protein